MNELFSAIVTPFAPTGEVNYEAVRPLTKRALSLTSGGLYVCGSAGEGFLLSPEERKRMVEIVVDEVRGRADVIVNISHMEFRQAIHLAHHAAEVGATAVSTLPPIFNQISSQELIGYFRAVLDHIRLPLTTYNFPQQTHRPFDVQTVESLVDDPRLIGIKHTSEDTYMLQRFKSIAGGRLTVWSGRDPYYLGCLAMGADGAISSSFQLLGDVFLAITRAFRSRDQQRAYQLQQRVNELHARLQVHGTLRSIKRALSLLGLNAGECRLPFAPLGNSADDYLRETLDQIDKVRDDYGL